MDGLVVGSHDRNEVLLIRSHGDSKVTNLYANANVCGLCGDEVGVTAEGEAFAACDDCAFPICRGCYEYERREGAQVCPRCKTRFKRLKGCARVAGDDEDDDDDVDDLQYEFTVCEEHHESIHGRMAWKKKLEKWKSRQKLENEPDPPLIDEGRLPLSRKLPIPASQLNPYRLIVILRFVVLGFFFHYRISHPVNDAYALWLASVVCEIWFGISWILDQLPKWLPLNRETYLDRLSIRYEKEGQCSQLPSVDIFVTTVDPLKEPPLVTANTVLSVLALDYPVDKVSCYISDDGASILTFEALSETCEFARKWVPFCNRFSIEPRAPEWYFSEKMDYLKEKIFPEFIRERRAIKREYEEFKVRMNALVAKAQKAADEGWKMLHGTPWPGNNANDHPGMIQMFLGQSGGIDGKELPCLVYVSREKRLGFDHHKKAGAMNALARVSAVVTNAPYILNLDCDHYINNSKALREAMCFMMDGKRVGFVQFPVMLDGNDEYASRNTVFFDINMKGLDGIQGPIYLGTGCVFRRVALYGYGRPESEKSPARTCSWWPRRRRNKRNLPQTTISVKTEDEEGSEEIKSERSMMKLDHKLGNSPIFAASTLLEGEETTSPNTSEAIHVIGCGYEEKTDWGKEVGWIYGSTTEDLLTGFKIHCRGWRSIYCNPPRPAFRGRSPENQELRRAFGSVEIFLSMQSPLWYGHGRSRLKLVERLSYINFTLYPFASIPLLIYSILPAVCLLTEKFTTPEVDSVGGMLFVSVFVCVLATCMLEMRWSGVGFREWWRNQQAWMMGGVSAHLFAVAHGLLKSAAGIEMIKFSDLSYLILIPPITVLMLNLIGVVAGISSGFGDGYESVGRMFFAFWVVAHLYPFVKGIGGRPPTMVVVWSIIIASVFSFLWLRIDPFLPNFHGPALQDCGLDC